MLNILVSRGQLDEALRIRQDDAPEVVSLLASALADATALQLPEAEQIRQFIRQLGGDPDAPPFSSSSTP